MIRKFISNMIFNVPLSDLIEEVFRSVNYTNTTPYEHTHTPHIYNPKCTYFHIYTIENIQNSQSFSPLFFKFSSNIVKI